MAMLTTAPSPVGRARVSDRPEGIATLTLAEPRPNPMRGHAAFSYSAPAGVPVRLEVFDVSGRHIVRLAEEMGSGATRSLAWDGRDTRGSAVASGIYFVRLTAGQDAMTRKLLVQR